MLTAPQEKILRQILRLIDLSGELHRNTSDSEFNAIIGNEILTVVDENIFEMFVRPSRHREAVETFYADIWKPSGEKDSDWRSFESQAALITAEFILTRRGDRLLMNDHHRWELAHRIEWLTSEIREELARGRKSTRREIARKFAIISDLQKGKLEKAVDVTSGLSQKALEADIAELSDAPTAVVERFRIARVAAAFFANDQLIEPLDQLRRTVSFPMRHRLSSIQSMFHVRGREATLLESDADRWFVRLAEELKQPGHRQRRRAQRELASIGEAPNSNNSREGTARAMRNDARSIAFMQWVASTQLVPTRRLVFITGDPVLFDAYRRWHLRLNNAGRSAPFIMRRATQYTPIFNPNDSGGDLSVSGSTVEKSLLFTLIQQAVEAALVPFALPLLPKFVSAASDGVFDANRERLALKLIDQESLSHDKELTDLAGGLSSDWIRDRASEIANVRKSWQKAQRFAIGASTDLIKPRLGYETQEAAKHYFDQAARDAGPILNKYVTGVLDKLVDDSIQLWVPLAERFRDGSFDQSRRDSTFTKRFSAALNVEDEGGEGREVRTPISVFTSAACRALEAQEIASANRFAGLALRADKVARARRGQHDSTNPDLLYLDAVTHRYLISTVNEHLIRTSSHKRRNSLVLKGVDQVKLSYGRALNQIERCITIHSTEMDATNDPSVLQSIRLRYLRALSERAALNLFMATSFGLAFRNGPSLLLAEWDDHLDTARGDLWRCIKVDTYNNDSDDPLLAVIRAQFIPNVAAYEVLAFILRGGSYKIQPWPKKIRRRILDFRRSGKDIHPLLSAELAGYFILSGDKAIPKTWLRLGKRAVSSLKLPLDRALYSILSSDLPRPAP